MPPRKRGAAVPAAASQPPAAPPLDGCVISLSGSLPGGTQAAIESKFLKPLGAALAKSITAATTHLVTTEDDYKKPSTKVSAAKGKGLPIVTFQWLEDTLDKMSKLDVDDYSLDKPSAASQPAATSPAPTAAPASTGAKKRGAAKAVDNDSQSQPQKKKKGSEVKDEPADDVMEDAEEKEAKVAEGQIAKSLDVKIPLDEGASRNYFNYTVYINDDGVIYDASLNQTNASNNNNKFYRVQILRNAAGDHRTWTRWGRVGEYGTDKALGDGTLKDALVQFDKKFKDKSGYAWADRAKPPKSGKYAFIEKSYEPDSDDEDDEASTDNIKAEAEADEEEVASKLPKAVQDLMELIFNQDYFNKTMQDLNYDAKKLPLGKLSKSTILKGFQALKDLSALLDTPSLASSQYNTSMPAATEQLSNLYYTLIPHSFGRNRPPIIRDQTMLKKEIELLESLGDMKDAAALMKADRKDVEKINQLDRQFQGLGMEEMTPLEKTSTEFNELKNYLVETRGFTHNANYDVQEIFRIERQGETDRFDKSPFSGPPRDRRLLWHGSRATNFGGILSQGLRIAPPEAPVSGYMFGKGIYLADMSSKSANYCCSYISGGHALLLLCEAELGDPMQELTASSYNAGETAKANDMISTWGKGMTAPSKWKDAGCVHPSLQGVKMPDTVAAKPGPTNVPHAYLQYNEFICYDVAQIRLRYLLRVKM
ncbi:poly polymerase catalytic domain-containing protein [Microdochium trichocladiopsis]|uniref:Poly [ADP-ribose] polymerase n=1 Tax=Microdochium trichocladiopsis TaxID=1682393 RepID=A0A9P8XZB2_9PEZI|nr:poly polymerase catalytic domain-containing protein [Microdochium trichocladiopsis]KAH7026475.1 poly polymerase catalytic domain-containing protein [Microdochium trichocladiopsis]